MSRNKAIERRKHQRFQVVEGAFTINTAKSGLITDISMGGMTFQYIDRKAWAEKKPSSVDILLDDDNFYLDSLPCESVADFVQPCDLPDKNRVVKRHSIKFRNLTPQQTAQLEFFISHYTKHEGV